MATSVITPKLPEGVYRPGEVMEGDFKVPAAQDTAREKVLLHFVFNPTLGFTSAFFIQKYPDLIPYNLRRILFRLAETGFISRTTLKSGENLYKYNIESRQFLIREGP